MSDYMTTFADIVDMNQLERILISFSKATGLTFLVTDMQGRSITSHQSFRPICKRVRRIPHLSSRCIKCDAYAGIECSLNDEPCIYRCHMGFVEVCVPLTIDNNTLANIFTGQILLDESDQDAIPYLLNKKTDWKDEEELAPYYDSDITDYPVMTSEQIKNYIDLLKEIANYIVKVGKYNILQNKYEQNESKLEDTRNLFSQSRIIQNSYNSNFIQETLSTIYSSSVLEKADKTASMLQSFSDVLQNLFSLESSFIRIEQLSSKLHECINIYNTVYDQKVLLKLKIDPSVDNAIIPGGILLNLILVIFNQFDELKKECEMIGVTVERNASKLGITFRSQNMNMPATAIKSTQAVITKFLTTEIAYTMVLINNQLSSFFKNDYQFYTEQNIICLEIPADHAVKKENEDRI